MLAMIMLAVLQAALGSPPVLLKPETVIRPGDYPEASMSRHEFGVVSFLLTISPKGGVSRCDITESSGFATLDAQTCRLVTTRGRFDPAHDANGAPVEGQYRSASTWALESDQPMTKLSIAVKVTQLPSGYKTATKAKLLFDATGHVVRCEITAKSGSDGADQSLCAYAMKQVVIPAPKSGSPGVAPMGIRFLTGTISVAARAK